MKMATKKKAETTGRKKSSKSKKGASAVKKVSFAVDKLTCRRSLQFGSIEDFSANDGQRTMRSAARNVGSMKEPLLNSKMRQ